MNARELPGGQGKETQPESGPWPAEELRRHFAIGAIGAVSILLLATVVISSFLGHWIFWPRQSIRMLVPWHAVAEPTGPRRRLPIDGTPIPVPDLQAARWDALHPTPSAGGRWFCGGMRWPLVRVDGTPRDEEPRLLSIRAPVYPAQARALNVHGEVIFDVLVGTDGRAHDIQFLQSIPLLDEAARTSLEGTTFRPAQLSGRAVAVRALVPVKFSLI